MHAQVDKHTRGEQTRYLSREFIIGLLVQSILVIGGGAYAYGTLAEKVSSVEPAKVTDLQAKVAVLESKQIDGDRITRLEESIKNLDKSLLRVQAALDRNFYGDPPPARK